MKEQTGTGADMRSGLDVRFGLQPVEEDFNSLPQGADVGGRSILRNQNVVLYRHDLRRADRL